MSTCPKCGSEQCVKDGIVKERQRYRCKLCNFRHTVQHRGKGPSIKRQALDLYLEGLGVRSIGRFLKCSHVTVYNWIKAFGEVAEENRSESTIEVVGIYEMHTYISSKKNYCWIWIAVDRYGKKSVNCILGDRSTATGKKLWGTLKN